MQIARRSASHVGNMIAFPVAWYVHIWTEGEGFEQLTGGQGTSR